MRHHGILAGALSLSLVFSACDSGSGSPVGAQCGGGQDCPGDQVCFEGKCVTPSPDDASGSADTGQKDVSQPTDTVKPKPDGGEIVPDTKPPFDPGPPPDLIPDKTPPGVKSIDPKDGQMNVAVPFKVTITFTEPVKNATEKTIHVTDVHDNEIEGVVAASPTIDVYTWTPTKPVLVASPYRVTVNNPTVIMDAAGNKMQGFFEATFHTAGPKNMASYSALALKYAPVLRVGGPTIVPLKPELDIPVKLDLDADWQLKDNATYLADDKTKKLSPAVYFTVLETESHYYIHYVYYWPRRENVYDEEAFDNDSAGALVVVAKWPAEAPVEVLTWFRTAGDYIRAYASNESAILDGDASNQAVDGTKPAADLFPDNRFQAFVPGGKHESCLWNDGGQGTYSCELIEGEKGFYELWTLSPATKPTLIEKAGTKFPRVGDADYELVEMIDSWWPRRMQEAVFWNTVTTYAVTFGAESKTAKFPRFFINEDGTGQGEGRTAFGVVWKPADLKPYTAGLPQGMYFFDPPQYLKSRHKSAYFGKPFDAATKEGFSYVFCFNPYVGIDQRGASDVCP